MRSEARLARRAVELLGSLRLTVVCLACAVVLVFWGTLVQVEIGVYAAQVRFFRSWLVMLPLPGSSVGVPVFPGGYLVGSVMLVNLVCAFVERRRLTWPNLGLWLIHAGLLLLLLGQVGTDLLAVESTMRLTQDEARWHSEDLRRVELAIVETTHPEQDEVVAIPESLLARGGDIEVPSLPFTVRVRRYLANSTPLEGPADGGVSLATDGVGRRMDFRAAPRENGSDRRNMPTAYVELAGAGGSLGTWLTSLWLNAPQTLTVSNRTFDFSLRPMRYYRPFALELIQFIHERHPGTAIPRNFESEVRIKNPGAGEDRPVRIRMNSPLRYQGETFYQSGYDERDPRVSILQVVKNPAWVTPYLSCLLITLGLVQRFIARLITFLRGAQA